MSKKLNVWLLVLAVVSLGFLSGALIAGAVSPDLEWVYRGLRAANGLLFMVLGVLLITFATRNRRR